MGSSLRRPLFAFLIAAATGIAAAACVRGPVLSPPASPPLDRGPAMPGSREGPTDRIPASSMAAPASEWNQSRFEDVPLPPGFALEQDASFTFVQGSLRRADLRYEGTEPVSRVIRFYQEAMKTNGWNFLRLTGVQMKTLTYVKGGELCEVMIESHSEADPEEGHHVDSEGKTDGWTDPGEAATTHLHIKLGPV